MSHIGCRNIRIPEQVQVVIQDNSILVKGVLGAITLNYNSIIITKIVEEGVSFLSIVPSTQTQIKNIRKIRTYWGMYRTLINNNIIGVSQGYTKSLDLIGIGYKASISNNTLIMKIGNSYDMVYLIPDDVKIECPRPTTIIVSGIDKQRVNQVAANIRSYRSPEPYKGKGIRYLGEVVPIKEGKKK